MVWQLIFGKPRKIASFEELARFCDEQAAFNCQKNIYEFVRARASSNAQSLFEEEAFKEALNQARWRGYPLALTNMMEMVSVMFRTSFAEEEEAVAGVRPAVRRIASQLMRGYENEQPFEREEWLSLTEKVDVALVHATNGPMKAVKDIPIARARAFFDLIPFHEEIKAPDFPSIENHMKVNLCRAHDELLRKISKEEIAVELVKAAKIPCAPYLKAV